LFKSFIFFLEKPKHTQEKTVKFAQMWEKQTFSGTTIHIDPPFCAGSVFKSKAWGENHFF